MTKLLEIIEPILMIILKTAYLKDQGAMYKVFEFRESDRNKKIC